MNKEQDHPETLKDIFKGWVPVIKKDKKGLTAYQRGLKRLQQKEGK